MKEFKETLSVEEATRLLYKNIRMKELEVEEVYLKDGLNRILGKDVIAPVNLPPFDKSAVDGYAVIAEDTFGASQTNPCILTVIGSVRIGEVPDLKVGRLEAVEVSTGSIIPHGADAVVMVENTKRIDEGRIEVYLSVAPGENVSRMGEDIKKGDTVLRKGTRLKPQHLGVLASLGFVKVSVFRMPKVAVLSTGDELAELGTSVDTGKTIDVNRLIISSMVEELGLSLIH
ncbi:MAG: molybdopterin molybdotransferase MoeA, partial [Nitrososphaerales archaeon]|nr:molybdopterin molybdotransferase MoeA [Nitrososphaerales archaeon]